MKTIIQILLMTVYSFSNHHVMSQVPDSPSNAVNAVWLLPYDLPNEQHEHIMQTHRSSLKQLPPSSESAFENVANLMADPLENQFASDTGQGLTAICPNIPFNINECIAQIRQKQPESRRLLQTHAKLLQRIDALADYGILHDSDFAENTQLHMLNIRFPRYEILIKPSPIAAIAQWLLGQPETAMRRACRNVQTGKLFINSNMGLISAMVGANMVNHNLQLMAHIDADTPNLPDIPECRAALTPLPDKTLTLCHVLQTEHTLQQRFIATQTADELSKYRYVQAQNEAVNQFVCSAPFTQTIQADQKAVLPQLAGDEMSAYLAEQYHNYFHRIQDTQLKIGAAQAAWQINRLASRRPQDVEPVLQRYSTPNRRLRLQDNSIVFDAYAENGLENRIPLRAIK